MVSLFVCILLTVIGAIAFSIVCQSEIVNDKVIKFGEAINICSKAIDRYFGAAR